MKQLAFPVALACLFQFSPLSAELIAQDVNSTKSQQTKRDDSLKHLEWLVGRWKQVGKSDVWDEGIGIGSIGDGEVFKGLSIRLVHGDKALEVRYTYELDAGFGCHSTTLREIISVLDDDHYKVVVELYSNQGKRTRSKELHRKLADDKRLVVGGEFGVPLLTLRSNDEDKGKVEASFDPKLLGGETTSASIEKRLR